MLVVVVSAFIFIVIILTDPASVEENVVDTTVNETFSISLVCTISGIPRPSITWYRYQSSPVNRTEVTSDGAKFNITNTYEIGDYSLQLVTSTLTIFDADKSDELFYQCVGNNDIENFINTPSDSTAFLTIQGMDSCVYMCRMYLGHVVQN